jgi:hypothetical protein
LIVDIHTHVWWYPDHIGERWASEALASKLVKLDRCLHRTGPKLGS